MANLKHIGRIKTTGRKVIVAYRTLPGESDAALIIPTEALTPEQHDSIISLVESPAGQNAYEFAEVLARSRFPDGSVILANLHFNSRLVKVKTSTVEMLPNSHSTIGLDQLNQVIAEQRGLSVNDLALGNGSSAQIEEIAKVTDISNTTKSNVVAESQVAKIDAPLSDDDLARKYRSDADKLYKEAARLRSEAEKLAPAKKKVSAET
jgi:hypothetical protein